MALRIDLESRVVRLSVRDLAQVGLRDRFRSSPPFSRLAQGQALHAHIQTALSSEHPEYRSEVYVRRDWERQGWTISVSGRIDGVYEEADDRRPGENPSEVWLEEIKTVPESTPDLLLLGEGRRRSYELQLLFYGSLFEPRKSESPKRCRLLLASQVSRETRTWEIEFDTSAVETLLEERLDAVLVEAEAARRLHRDRRQTGEAMRFPFPTVRPSQQEVLDAVERGLEEGSSLLLEAPAGIGKTVASLYPALRHALRTGKKVYFATAKGTQSRVVLETLAKLREGGAFVRAVFLRAKAKMCAHSEILCHEDHCPFADRYSMKLLANRLPRSLQDEGVLDSDRIFEAGVEYEVCPFELSLDLIEGADLVVGDYNYVIDPRVALHDYFSEAPYSNWILLVDEAHNLVPRGMDAYSPSLSRDRIREVWEDCRVREGDVFLRADLVLDDLDRLLDLSEEELEPGPREDGFLFEPDFESWKVLGVNAEGLLVEYLRFRAENESLEPEDSLLDLLFQLQHFVSVIGMHGPEFSYLWFPSREGRGEQVKILCKDPSRFLGPRLQGFHASVFLSATLRPAAFYRDLAGLSPVETRDLSLPSPFPRDHREVVVMASVSTRYRDRDSSYERIAAVLAEVAGLRIGNYLAFFPSHEYRRRVGELLPWSGPELVVQEPSMNEEERSALFRVLAAPPVERSRILLGVQGGIFSEGIDYVGELCVGVFVVSPALPMVSSERELIRSHYQERFGRGFEYAYVVPGMSRVIQAAGRLIRGHEDRGVIVLVGNRFATSTYCSFFPREWYSEDPQELVKGDVRAAVSDFWGRQPAAGLEREKPRSDALIPRKELRNI